MQSARGFEYGVQHIISPQSGSLIDVLLSTLSLDLAQAELLISLGSIYLNHKRVKENSSVLAGDYLRVHTKPRRFLPDDGRWHERILFNNEHFLVVNKVSALPVHASVDNTQENLQAYLEKLLNAPLFITHRLDVPTRGLMVYAKTKEFQVAYNQLLAERGMKKIYRALVTGHPTLAGLWTHYMEPSPRAPKKVDRQAHEGWQQCQLEILNIKKVSPENSELHIHLITGRTHQIRAQLGHEGFPIVGDHAYGAPKISAEEKIELEACELNFTNPLTGEFHRFCL